MDFGKNNTNLLALGLRKGEETVAGVPLHVDFLGKTPLYHRCQFKGYADFEKGVLEFVARKWETQNAPGKVTAEFKAKDHELIIKVNGKFKRKFILSSGNVNFVIAVLKVMFSLTM